MQVQGEFDAILAAEKAAREQLIAQERDILVAAGEGLQPSKVLRAAIEKIEHHEQKDLLLSALVTEMSSTRALLVRRERGRGGPPLPAVPPTFGRMPAVLHVESPRQHAFR